MSDNPQRMFTDYIQDWVGDVNWAWIIRQAKAIKKEYAIDFNFMRMVLKYCKEYEELDWDLEYGLYQFFPRYIKPTQEFCEQITRMKKMDFDCEDEVYIVKKKKLREREVDFS